MSPLTSSQISIHLLSFLFYASHSPQLHLGLANMAEWKANCLIKFSLLLSCLNYHSTRPQMAHATEESHSLVANVSLCVCVCVCDFHCLSIRQCRTLKEKRIQQQQQQSDRLRDRGLSLIKHSLALYCVVRLSMRLCEAAARNRKLLPRLLAQRLRDRSHRIPGERSMRNRCQWREG